MAMAQQAVLPEVVREQWVPMTWKEFLDWCDEGQSEWVDGKGMAYVSNNARHERLLQFLNFLLQSLLLPRNLGEVFVSNMILRLPSRPSGRMPDVFVILTENRHRVHQQWVEGPADFGSEILSDESIERDLELKLHEYRDSGQREYLALDGRTGKSIFRWYRLTADGGYRLIEPDDRGRYHSVVIPGFWLDPTWFTQDPLPNVLDVLRTIQTDANS
jgi:Uma2 family endonuclease